MNEEYNAKTQAVSAYGIGGIDTPHHPPTITSRLKGRKADLEHQLSKINDALIAIEKNPEIQNVFDAISRAGY